MPSDAARRSLEEQVAEHHATLLAEPTGGAAAYLTERGINKFATDRFQLGYTGTEGKYRDRLVIPYLTPAGPYHLKYRCILPHNCKDENHKKYMYDEGADIHLYNAHTLLTADRVAIVEGELDAVAVEMAGVPAVAYPGTGMWKKHPYWRWCFDSIGEVVVVADGDRPREDEQYGAGEIAAREVTASLRSALPETEVRMAVMPTGHDSNSYLQEFGQLEYLTQIGFI